MCFTTGRVAGFTSRLLKDSSKCFTHADSNHYDPVTKIATGTMGKNLALVKSQNRLYVAVSALWKRGG